MNTFMGKIFGNINDLCIDRTKKHPIETILALVFCGTLAGYNTWIEGYNTWIDFEDFAYNHFEKLKEFIDLSSGVPSHDTISRVISALKVEEFEKSFHLFVEE